MHHVHHDLKVYGGIKLFAGTGSPELAQKIADYLDQPVSGREVIEFPNENLFVKLNGSARGQDVYVIQTTSSPVHRNLMELLIMIQTLRLDSAARITAVVPYLCYGRSDKKDQPRVPITARLVADLPDFDPDGIRFVARAEAPGVPVAFAKTELRPDDDGRPVGWIGQIGVLPAHRGVGLGRWLLRWGVAYLRGRGAGAVELAVEAANDRALGLYLRNGFEPAVEWPHWVLPVDALIPANV